MPFEYKSSGVNKDVCSPPDPRHVFTQTWLTKPSPGQGNHYCARDYGSSAVNSNSYHYSNK